MVLNYILVGHHYSKRVNDYNFGAQWRNGRGRRFFLKTNKTSEGNCLALAGKFLQKELGILFVFKIIL